MMIKYMFQSISKSRKDFEKKPDTGLHKLKYIFYF